MAEQPIVEMQGISVEFPGVKALDDVKFRLFPGEVHSLMGENGAGKSTLIKALTGVYQVDSGDIYVADKKRSFKNTSDAQHAGVSTVYQEVNLCTNLSIGDRKSTRLNSSHVAISYAVFCLKKKMKDKITLKF